MFEGINFIFHFFNEAYCQCFRHIWKKYSCTNCLFVCISIKKYMVNEDKLYVVFVGKRPSVCTTCPKCQAQVICYKGNIYKPYRTHREVVLAWVMYEPRWKVPNATIESSKPKEVNQVIGQLVNDQVLKKIKDWKQNFLLFLSLDVL